MMFRPTICAMLCVALLPLSAQAESVAPQGLFDVYQGNRERDIANLVTPDLLLVSYSLLRQQLNQQAEAKIVIPAFQALLNGLQKKLAADKSDAIGQLGRDYLTLLQAMQTGELAKKSPAHVQKEWELIQQAAGVAESPVWGIPLDYSQFKPRGRYTMSESLQHFFTAYRYANSVNFFVQPSLATGVSPEKSQQMTQLAVRLSQIINKNPFLKAHFDSLNQASNWEYGAAGDLSAQDVPLALIGVKESSQYGAALLAYAQKTGKLPQVIDFPVDTGKLDKNQKLADIAVGWRLIPGTLNPDSMATQAVLYPNTQQFMSPCGTINCIQPWTVSRLDGIQAKGYVSGMEVMGWLGSETARWLSQREGDHLYTGYTEAGKRAQSLLQNDAGLSGVQMQFMHNVFTQKSEAPTRQLTSMLGFWTWQRNINALYAKQPSSAGSKFIGSTKVVARAGAKLLGGAAFYHALSQLAQQHLAHGDAQTWQQFINITTRLEQLADKAEGSLNEEEESYLNALDQTLLTLTKAKDAPIVIDVQTNPADKLVVEEAIGLPEIDTQGTARGAWFSHYEFKHPMSDRLTHEAWRKQIKNK
ncbi:MAG: DUF3160 domain-containing protein [Gallionella sp.]